MVTIALRLGLIDPVGRHHELVVLSTAPFARSRPSWRSPVGSRAGRRLSPRL